MPITGTETAAATSRTWPRANARIAAPERPPLPAPSQGRRVAGSIADGLQRVDQGDRVGAALLGRQRHRCRLGDVWSELDDQRLRCPRAQILDERQRLLRLLPDDQPGLDVRAGDVQLQGRDLAPARDPLDQARELHVARAHHGDNQRHRKLSQERQVLVEEPVEPLVGQADRVDHPGGCLEDPRRRVPDPGLRGDRLRNEGRERKLVQELLAEDATRGDRVEGPGAVQHRVLEAQPAELDAQVHQCPDPGTRAVSIRAASTTGPSTQSRM